MPSDSDMTIAGCGRCRVRPAEASGLCTTCETVLSDSDMVMVPRSAVETAAQVIRAFAPDEKLLLEALSATPVGEGASGARERVLARLAEIAEQDGDTPSRMAMFNPADVADALLAALQPQAR